MLGTGTMHDELCMTHNCSAIWPSLQPIGALNPSRLALFQQRYLQVCSIVGIMRILGDVSYDQIDAIAE